MTAIYKRELKSYFHSMIGYVFIAFLMAFSSPVRRQEKVLL